MFHTRTSGGGCRDAEAERAWASRRPLPSSKSRCSRGRYRARDTRLGRQSSTMLRRSGRHVAGVVDRVRVCGWRMSTGKVAMDGKWMWLVKGPRSAWRLLKRDIPALSVIRRVRRCERTHLKSPLQLVVLLGDAHIAVHSADQVIHVRHGSGHLLPRSASCRVM